MKVQIYGLKSFIVEEGIIQVFCHIEIVNDGRKLLFIDRIDIHGTIESMYLRTLLRRIHKYFKEKYGVE